MNFSNNSVLLVCKFLLGTGNSIFSYIYHVNFFLGLQYVHLLFDCISKQTV